jgi:hypothetical protein
MLKEIIINKSVKSRMILEEPCFKTLSLLDKWYDIGAVSER